MSRGGIGYEISFAYANFDNATMYPLIVLILLASVAINGVLSRWEQRLLVRRGIAMKALRSSGLFHSAVLIVALVAIWQGLYGWVGERCAGVAARDAFLHGEALRQRFLRRASHRYVAGVRDRLRAVRRHRPRGGVLAGVRPAFGRHAGADDRLGVCGPEAHAVSDLLLAFGLGLSAKVAFGVLHGVIPIILFTLSAVHNTKPILIKTGRVLNLSRWQTVRWILFRRRSPKYSRGCASASRSL